MMLTQQRLKEVLHYDPESGLFFRIEGPKCGLAGTIQGNGYVQITVDGATYYAHRLAWLYMKGAWPEGLVDHKDGNRKGNWFGNLREATHKQNAHNRSGSVGQVPHNGISFEVQTGSYRTCIKIDGKYHKKRFKLLEDAVEYNNFLRAEAHGEFACTQRH